jgi:uncharacterized paraquat-inducible protein A
MLHCRRCHVLIDHRQAASLRPTVAVLFKGQGGYAPFNPRWNV